MLTKAQSENRLEEKLLALTRPKLLIIDEIGYLPLGPSGANLTAAQDLVENQHVFAVVNESPFAFLAYRWLLDHNVPMMGNGVDGTYYQQKGNEAILSSGGNGNPFGDLTYDGAARIMKLAGAKKIGVLAYGAASSSVASAKSQMLDRELFRFDEVWAAAGHPHAVVKLSPHDLERLTGAPVADVV